MNRHDIGEGLVTAMTPQIHEVPTIPPLLPGQTTSASISFEPATARAGEWGTWTLTCRVGADPIERLGGLRIQLPEAWHAGIRNSSFRVQASSPREPNYVSVRSSKPGAWLRAIVEGESDEAFDKRSRLSNLIGRAGYYDYVTRILLDDGRLEEGDTVSVVFGDTSDGSRGFRAGIRRLVDGEVVVAVDHGGDGTFRLHSGRPPVRLEAEEPAELLLTIPSDAVVGRAAMARIALVDGFGNPCDGWSGRIDLEVAEGEASLPGHVSMVAGRGWVEVPCVPATPGWLRLRARAGTKRLEALGNPARVHETEPATRVCWGDIHSHTEIGADGVGPGREAYDYARHVSGLDFYSRTDHSEFFAEGDEISDFAEYVRLADERDDPGAFVTLHGYEVSFGPPFGHHNVYFRDRPGPLVSPRSVTLPQLWQALADSEALTIPHHTLKMPSLVDWTGLDDSRLVRNFEIYSAHGLSEAFDPYHPLAMEQSLFTNPSSTSRTGMSAQRAWEDGRRLSTIASSDDHRAHPGQPHFGLVAVRAVGLSREQVFDALVERRTYATTGARIILDFSVAGIDMGGQGSADVPVAVRCRARGTDVIESVEVLRHVAGQPGFQVINESRLMDEEIDWTFADEPEPGEAIYYVRLRQRSTIRERVAMAWSSPVWVSVGAGHRGPPADRGR